MLFQILNCVVSAYGKTEHNLRQLNKCIRIIREVANNIS